MSRGGSWLGSTGTQGAGTQGTHVGPCEGAPAAALVRLLVAPQLTEGPCLAEQCPDVLAIQAQRFLAVLQRLLIQALRRGAGGSASGTCYPLPPRPPAPFPAEMEDAGEPGSGRGVPELQETALAFLLWSRASTSPADGAAHGRWQATGAAGPSNCTVMSVVFQTHLLPHLPSAQSAMDRE